MMEPVMKEAQDFIRAGRVVMEMIENGEMGEGHDGDEEKADRFLAAYAEWKDADIELQHVCENSQRAAA